jgi:hypothetical protein
MLHATQCHEPDDGYRYDEEPESEGSDDKRFRLGRCLQILHQVDGQTQRDEVECDAQTPRYDPTRED